MELSINSSKGSGTKIQISDDVFAKDFNEPLIHQVVTAYLAGGRSGTKAQKSRGQVRGGGKKPWRQKGTGGARAGTIRSPLWRGGGIIFAAVPRDFSQKVNRKMYRGAIRSILSELIRQNRLQVIDELLVEQPRTKELLVTLSKYKIDYKIKTLIVTNDIEQNLYLAARNLPQITVCNTKEINPVNLIKYEKIIITKQAIEKINEELS